MVGEKIFKTKRNLLKESLDILFIMILCFSTLLSTMILRGKVLVGDPGTQSSITLTFNLPVFIALLLILLFYLSFLLKTSNRELKKIIDIIDFSN